MKQSKKTQDALVQAKAQFAANLQQHMSDEYNVQIGLFEAEELFQESFREVAPILYNQGLMDAKEFMQERFHDLSEDVIQLEIAPDQKKRR